MPIYSTHTSSSEFQHNLSEFILCGDRLAPPSATNVANELPRKRGVPRRHVKHVLCEGTSPDTGTRIRLKRLPEVDATGYISSHAAQSLGLRPRGSSNLKQTMLPLRVTGRCTASLLIDSGVSWSVETHALLVIEGMCPDVIWLPPILARAFVPNASRGCFASSRLLPFHAAAIARSIAGAIFPPPSPAVIPPVETPPVGVVLLKLIRMQASEYLSNFFVLGGGPCKFARMLGSEIARYSCEPDVIDATSEYTIIEHFGDISPNELNNNAEDSILTRIPLSVIASRLYFTQLIAAGVRHSIFLKRNESKESLIRRIQEHCVLKLPCCLEQVTTLKFHRKLRGKRVPPVASKPSFPPPPSDQSTKERIISSFCAEFEPKNVLESGCLVCGQLTLCKDLTPVDDTTFDWSLLCNELVTTKERRSDEDIECPLPGPVVDTTCERQACKKCLGFLTGKRPKRPPYALANGLWLGNVPKELQSLTFAERLLISRVRFNYCVVKVTSSMHYKMRANAIMFPSPVAKIYNILPPKKGELDEVLAYLFIGPHKPTQTDHERAPMLVRRNKVWDALTWLKMNHTGYRDLQLSKENLETYEDNSPPVIVNYRKWVGEKEPESSGVYTEPENEGTTEGPCPFAVHTVEAADLSIDTDEAELKNMALLHLKVNESNTALGVGRGKEPESLYQNPSLYPNAFPWLFPYGLGGLELRVNGKQISDTVRKRQLLLYHDKRFQLDPYFHLVAFNHEQIKQGAKGGFLTAKKSHFPDLAKRMLHLDVGVLSALQSRMEAGEHVVPRTEEEKLCFQVIHDLDHVGRHVSNSKTNKKDMKNELWSTICSKGAPSWFITFAPSDTRHPLALYFAGSSECMYPKIYDTQQMEKMIARNPVACARFFHFMVNAFTKHILGCGSSGPGLFGHCDGFYGTVEEQGRLRLHLHLVSWIKGSLTPQEIRDKLEDKDSPFQQDLIAYLESAHSGAYVASDPFSIAEGANLPREDGFRDATYALPQSPPQQCDVTCGECEQCQTYTAWKVDVDREVDELLWRVNSHARCHAGCTSKKFPKCKSRFPRKVVTKTTVDPDTGHLEMRHGEPTLNTFHPVLTYLLRCNSDVTSLLSGTSLKAVIAYVTDYITKNPLRTHTMFDVIRSVFRRNDEYLNGDSTQEDKAHKLLVQITNSLTVKQEIGAPMASAYLLGHPDHYTNFSYKPFYWRPYVWEVKTAWASDGILSGDDHPQDEARVIITKTKTGGLTSYTTTQDYMLRPKVYDQMSLYEWIERYVKSPVRKRENVETESDAEDNDVDKEDNSDNETDSDAEDPSVEESDSEYEPSFDEPVRITLSQNVPVSKRFLKGHPQRLTHSVSMLAQSKSRIPVFSGGLLPRKDQGVAEEFYIAMLTLYKPWRTGKDLKEDSETWVQAYDQFQCPPRFLEIQKRCNIRYECHDARDDYRLSRKKEEPGLFFMHGQFAQDSDNRRNDESQLDGNEPADFHLDYSAPTSEAYRTSERMKKEMESALIASNWQRVGNSTEPKPVHEVLDGSEQTSKGWSALLEKAKEAEINERNVRMQGIDVDAPGLPLTYMEVDAVDGVEVMDKSYFSRYCEEATPEDRERMDATVQKFTLNTEQERAFRLVANHSLLKVKEPLAMHLGGMGGTGKSRVINALIDFFKLSGKGHIFLIVAPTGTAASLVGGQTYHSVLAFNNGGVEGKGGRVNTSPKALHSVRDRLKVVEYVFMDEISMLNCEGLCNISSQMVNSLKKNPHETSTPFAGKSMIWAGDFAQLPPIDGKRLFNIDVESTVHTTGALKSQKSNIGRALWHQVTDVVILKQNMRQKTQSKEDGQYRTMLENLRYNSCTAEDLAVLKQRVAGPFNPSIDLNSEEFRHASLITGRNHCRDRINEIGCRAFAKDTGQALHKFYSVDELRSVSVVEDVNGKKRTVTKQLTGDEGRMSERDQDAVWAMDPTQTKHHAGILSLCVGMPVLIKYNVATELCITNGAEATVVGWKRRLIGKDKYTLDALFVQLSDPKKDIKLEGLPINVVPIAPQKQNIEVLMPSGKPVNVSREQVPVHPNFAMTDYCSQGRTRPINVVDLQHCNSYHSVYTALSRSSSYAGTVIIRMPETRYLKGNLPRGLRQEFRELEMLNEITRLRCEGSLDKRVKGKTRERLITNYQLVYKNKASPPDVHSSIAWQAGEALTPTPDDENWKYQPNPARTTQSAVPEDNMKNSKSDPKKRKPSQSNDPSLDIVTPPRKKKKPELPVSSKKNISRSRDLPTRHLNEHYGPKWQNMSCAFDSVLFVMYNIIKDSSSVVRQSLSDLNDLWPHIVDQSTEAVRTGRWEILDIGRDVLRSTLIRAYPEVFNYEANGVGDLCEKLMRLSSAVPEICFKCKRCGNVRWRTGPRDALWTILPDDNCNSLSDSLKYIINGRNQRVCEACGSVCVFASPPLPASVPVFCVATNGVKRECTATMTLSGVKYLLRGIVYGGGGHFTSRLITKRQEVYAYDGYEKNTAEHEGHFRDMKG